MRGEDELLQQILKEPDSDRPRLEYADWIEDHDGPRAEFIRLQCALAHLAEGDPRRTELAKREQTILSKHEVNWIGPLRGVLFAFKFQRGFLDEVLLNAKAFLAQGDALYRLGPIRNVHLSEARPVIADLASSVFLSRIKFLDLSFNQIDVQCIRTLFASPYLTALTKLKLEDNDINYPCIRALCDAPKIAQLEELYLARNPVGDPGLNILTTAPNLTGLLVLDLSGDALSSGAGPTLANARFTRLTALELLGNTLGDVGLEHLARAACLSHLTRLNLSNTFLTDVGAGALASSPFLYQLRTLDLSGNRLSDACVPTLTSSNTLSQVTRINVKGNPLTEQGLQALRVRWGDGVMSDN